MSLFEIFIHNSWHNSFVGMVVLFITLKTTAILGNRRRDPQAVTVCGLTQAAHIWSFMRVVQGDSAGSPASVSV